MTDESNREELRALQDRWLALGVVQNQIRNYGEQERIAGPTSPTFEDVRRFVLADWKAWFEDFFT